MEEQVKIFVGQYDPQLVHPVPALAVPEKSSGYRSRRQIRDRGPDDRGGRIQLKRHESG